MTQFVTTQTSAAQRNDRTERNEHSLPWSEMQDEQLRRLARANINVQVIGFRLGRRPEAVLRRADELGLHLIDRADALSD